MPNCACCITARLYAYAYDTLKSSFENFQQKLRQVKLERKEKKNAKHAPDGFTQPVYTVNTRSVSMF